MGDHKRRKKVRMGLKPSEDFKHAKVEVTK
jgi:hypothetical protein